MSPTQIRHNIKGEGFLGDLWSKVKTGAAKILPALKDKAIAHGEMLLPGVIDKVGKIVKGKLGNHPIADKIVDAAGQQLEKLGKAGLAKARGGKVKKMKGMGFLDQLQGANSSLRPYKAPTPYWQPTPGREVYKKMVMP